MIDAKARLRKITKTKSKKRHFNHSLHKSGTSGHFMSLISCKQKHDSTFPNNGRPLTILCYSRKSCMEESSIKRSKCRTSKSLTWTAVSATSGSGVASSASGGSSVFSRVVSRHYWWIFVSCPPWSLVSLVLSRRGA